jgi:hypothetical protein
MPHNPARRESRGDSPHPGYLGGLLEDQPVLIREAELVAFVTNIRAFPTGVLFVVCVEQATVDQLSDHLVTSGPVEVRLSDGTVRRSDADRFEGLYQWASESSSGPGGASWRGEYWLPGLPPPGPVTFRISVGATSGAATLDGGAIRHAAGRATDLWS